MAMVSLLDPVPLPETLEMDAARLRHLRCEFQKAVVAAAQMVTVAYAVTDQAAAAELMAVLARGEDIEAAVASLPNRVELLRALASCTSPLDGVRGLM